jgi:hypothetical protein
MLNLLPLLPGDIGDIETKVVLKKLTKAHQALAELKGVVNSIPNQGILINTFLERFINDDTFCDWDSLTKMAIIHHQFESIHPFVDELRIGRKTASKYLESLVDVGLLSKHKVAKENYYLNDRLFTLLLNVGTKQENGSWIKNRFFYP